MTDNDPCARTVEFLQAKGAMVEALQREFPGRKVKSKHVRDLRANTWGLLERPGSISLWCHIQGVNFREGGCEVRTSPCGVSLVVPNDDDTVYVFTDDLRDDGWALDVENGIHKKNL